MNSSNVPETGRRRKKSKDSQQRHPKATEEDEQAKEQSPDPPAPQAAQKAKKKKKQRRSSSRKAEEIVGEGSTLKAAAADETAKNDADACALAEAADAPASAGPKSADESKTPQRSTPASSPSSIRELEDATEFQALLSPGGSVGGGGSGAGNGTGNKTGNGTGSGTGIRRLVLACFSANWCRPCVVFAPKLELIARRYRRSVTFVKLNVDKLPDVADTYKVRAVPTFILFRSGSQIGSVAAASQARIEELLGSNGAKPTIEDGQEKPAADEK